MKKQQKLHHPQPSRKSTRLSSSSAAISPRTDDALALSLHVVEAPPLSICHPSHVEEDNSVRRSSRFTSNKYKCPTPEKSRSKSRSQKQTALVLSELRVSPRLSSSPSSPGLTLSTAVGSGEAGMKRRRTSEDKAAAGRSGKKAAAGSLSWGGKLNSRNELLVLPEPGSKSESRGCLSERCLRSRTVLMRVGDVGCSSIKERRLRSRVVQYAMVEPPAASEERAVTSGSAVNCLSSRSKKREKGKAAAKDAGDYALVELPEDDEERDWGSSEIPKIEMLALPQKSSISGERCLRSRTVKMQGQEERVKRGASVKSASGVKWNKKYSVIPKTDSSLSELPAVLEERVVGNGSGKNCSRSITKRREKEKAAAKDVGDYALIELPEDNEERDWRSSEIPKIEMLALPEKSSISSERCLRSRTVKMQGQEERVDRGASVKSASGVKWNKKYSVTPKKDSPLSESPAVLVERAVGNGSGKNCSRSTKRREKEKAAAKEVGDYALIELPENDEEKDWRSNEVPKFEMLALPEKRLISSKKCLRSRTVKMQVQVERGASLKSSGVTLIKKCSVTPRKDSSLGESPNVLEKRDTHQYHIEGMGEKSLRSRKIQLKLNVDDNAVGIPDPVGGGCNRESSVKSERNEKNTMCGFVGEPIPEEEAQKRWQWRYDLRSSREKAKILKKNTDEDDEIILNVESHYAKAKVGSIVLNIGDCVFVKGEGNKKHIGRIMEFFKTTEGEDYFRVQWFFRAEDTVLKDVASMNDKRRIFYSTLMNDNLLDCIISKVKILKVPPMLCSKQNLVKSAAFYYDMEYSVEYSTFRTLVSDEISEASLGSQPSLSNSILIDDEPITLTPLEILPNYESPKQELTLLDLYSGCGGMSTGLCLGAKLSSVNLLTKWAVDYNSAACESLKLNHPETNARNESAEDFLDLLKKWEILCKMYVSDIERKLKCELEELPEAEGCLSPSLSDTEESTGEYEVSRLVDICYGDPTERGKRGLHFKVRWKGYGPDDDTWESAEGLRNCQDGMRDFVRRGFNASILPLPGDVDVICGGPPCQGISGLNRFRNFDSPLDDERNRQIVVFMDIVEFLKPKYCLMENVVDIIKFDKGSLGRYALSRLVLMKYQARLGTIASGCYGLPQFRLRVFIWGAHPSQTLPQFPLPTHDVVVKYWPPIEFERNVVAYDEGQPRPLENAIVLGDSISDLPAVTNYETREEMAYDKPPQTEFQRCIRLSKEEMMGTASPSHDSSSPRILYDHRPLVLSENEYIRVTQIPRRKGANFRDLHGVVVGEDNVARRDPAVEPLMLPDGKLLIPDCVFTYEQGKSRKPFGRVWWDETISTVVTFPHHRSQALLHPEQDRLLTIRECARLQGFPDYYRFCGTTKERYCQIGNAVSIPVSRALGYALGMAHLKVVGDGPLMTLPPKFLAQVPSAGEML